MTGVDVSTRGRGRSALAALLVAALWLLSRPYRGVRHDALFYLGQVFHRLMPDRFGHDLFFAFGSQDRWSVFSPLMEPLVAHAGVAASEFGVLLACHLLFMAGCWVLTRDWPSATLRWASMMAVAVLPHTYGGLGAFAFAEPFLTARSLAEPFVLFALWQLQRERIVPALASVAIAAIFHPLLALPGVVVAWFYLVETDRRWAWALVALLVPVALGSAGVPPFDGLWRRFDPAWLAAIRLSNASAFVADYRLLDVVPVAFDALVLLLFIGMSAAEGTARLVRATLLAVVALTAFWGLGADILHDVLLVQLQLWRVYWLMHLLALLLLPRVAAHYATTGWAGRWCAAALLVAAVGVMSNWPTGWALLLWALAALAAQRWGTAVSATTAMAATWASVAAAALVSARVAALTMAAVRARPDQFDDPGPLLIVLGLPAVGMALAAAVAWLLAGTRWRQVAGVTLLLALFAYGVHGFDQRSAWQRRLEARDMPRPFDSVLPVDAQVYWDDDLDVPWMLAQRASFYSHDQGAGVLFNRGTALAFARRRDSLAGLALQRQLCVTLHVLSRGTDAPPTECRPTPAALVGVCHASPHPDWLVLTSPLPPAIPMRAQWQHDDSGSLTARKSYYLYACSALH